MPDWSRRRALRAVAATGAIALTGCSGGSSSSSETPPDRGDPVPSSELEVLFVRDTGNEPLFEGEGEDGNEGGRARPERRTRAEFLTSGAARDRVTFHSGSAADDLRAFVDGTDLESGSIYLIERPVSACYEARLVGVYREDDGVDVDLCQALRPAGIACSADGMDTVGVGIRLPFTGDSMSGHGWGWSGECGPRPTVASEGGDGS